MIRRLWQVFVAVLVATVLVQLAVQAHPHFAFEALFGFNALYGFFACAALILVAKGLGILFKRDDDYYRDD